MGVFWLSQICLLCGVACVMTIFRSKESNLIVFALAWSGAVICTMPCAAHATFFVEEGQAMGFKLWPWVAGYAGYGIGVAFYAFKIPERWSPGKYDYLGHGHNLFHTGCLIGALFHTWASLKCFHERQLFSCPETGLFN